MNWRKFCEIELGAVLDEHFPDGVIGRSDAVAMYAKCLSLINKTVSAFGGCETCFGKGYSTAAEIDRVMIFCGCDRGKQLERLANGANL